MPKLGNIRRGHLAKRSGEMFENVLHGEAYRAHWTVIKIPLGCRMLGANKMMRVRTDFDFVFVKGPRVLFIDSKTTKAKTYAHSAITDHQMTILNKLQGHGHFAGYIINFSELKKVVFFSGVQLFELRTKSSLKPDDGVLLSDEHGRINIDLIYLAGPASTR